MPPGRDNEFPTTSDFLWWYVISGLSVFAINAGVSVLAGGTIKQRIVVLAASLWSCGALWLFGDFLFHQNKLLFEVIASLGIALLVGRLLFNSFFDTWEDYFMCSGRHAYRWNRDPNDTARGLGYNVICGCSGILAFYLFHKIFR